MSKLGAGSSVTRARMTTKSVLQVERVAEKTICSTRLSQDTSNTRGRDHGREKKSPGTILTNELGQMYLVVRR